MTTSWTPETFALAVIQWQRTHGRHDLPWQINKTPYRVWLSEIMLQQTQVATVIAYFERFIARFPDVMSLARADQDEVLQLWTGLGYYNRARNLHKAAIIIANDYGGAFPNTLDALIALPGIGSSTAGAILSFAFNQPATILDGNVKRVLTRAFGVDQPIEQSTTVQTLWRIAVDHTPTDNIATYNQGMMDIGAGVCTRTQPKCHACPLQTGCMAYHAGNPTAYPVRTKKRKNKPARNILFAVVVTSDGVLLEKRPHSGIWPDLWCFPIVDDGATCRTDIEAQFPVQLIDVRTLPHRRHELTHLTMLLTPLLLTANAHDQQTPGSRPHCFVRSMAALPGGLPAPIVKLLHEVFSMVDCAT